MFWEWVKNRIHNKGLKLSYIKHATGFCYDTVVAHCRRPMTLTVGELKAISALIDEKPQDVLERILNTTMEE